MTSQHYRGNKKSANRAHYVRSALATVVLLLALGVFISAGLWQLDRASEKENFKARFAAGSIIEKQKAPITDTAAKEFHFRMFELTGQYDSGHQILLDSMVSAGRSGYQVLTPFHVGDTTVLVNRGWLKADPDRSQLPTTNVSEEPRTIVGRLSKLPEPGIRLAEPDTQVNTWPRRLLFPTRDQIAQHLGFPVANYQILLEPHVSDGYFRAWQAVASAPEKNLGYAFQWFAFAALTMFFYITINLRWRKQAINKLHAS
jgi:surfeit locus 1 family protein